jgi:hypothetical protein
MVVMSPSHIVGLEPLESLPKNLPRSITSPSHTVGLEHSRHPTRWAWNILFKVSPMCRQHCLHLGSEHGFSHATPTLKASHPTRWARNRIMGLHPTRWAWNILFKVSPMVSPTLSPSHTVGSELLFKVSPMCRQHCLHPNGGPQQTLQGFSQCRQHCHPTRSPSHTVGLEPQTTTLTKIRHINHFVKGAPFSNEVNFPKSEIMQSLVCCYQI